MKNPPERKSKRKAANRGGPKAPRKQRRSIAREPEIEKIKEAERANAWTNILRVLALIAAAAITVSIYSIRGRVNDFAAFGYPGIFLIALLSNATIFLPAPGLAVVFAMGSMFNPLGVAIAAGTGGALGELTGYLAGFSGQAVIERTDIYNRVQPWIQKYGGWAIMFFAAIPNPFFDLVGVAAGVSKMALWQFLIFSWMGQIIKMTMFAYAGAYSITWLTNLFIK